MLSSNMRDVGSEDLGMTGSDLPPRSRAQHKLCCHTVQETESPSVSSPTTHSLQGMRFDIRLRPRPNSESVRCDVSELARGSTRVTRHRKGGTGQWSSHRPHYSQGSKHLCRWRHLNLNVHFFILDVQCYIIPESSMLYHSRVLHFIIRVRVLKGGVNLISTSSLR